MANGTGLLRRAWLLVAVTISVVMVPQLFTGTEAPAAEGELEVIAAADSSELLAPPLVGWASAALAPALPRTPTTNATAALPSPTTTTTSTAAAATRHITTATTVPPATTEPPPTTTTTAAPAPPPRRPTTSEEGEASWYDIEGSQPGVCAHRTIAFGTVLTVTRLSTGQSITCTVGDRGPWVEGRMLDLHKEDFTKLAHPGEGVIQVRIEW